MSDDYFTYEVSAVNEERIAIRCGVTWDYCVDEGLSAYLDSANLDGIKIDIRQILDPELIKDIEDYACMNSYEIEKGLKL